ncbi:MAG: hypothetical protein IPP77_01415 [Bacteroidetes bacterium]|nr:hypothetical protein [Bacteroidota bacterium]
MANKNLIVRFDLKDQLQNLIWEEEHFVTTNQFGLFNLEIGQGTNTGAGLVPSFSRINWASEQKFLEVKIDMGSGFIAYGNVQLISVPYSLVVDTALHVPSPNIYMQDIKTLTSPD